ncbi:hypothetical protein CEXT_615451 [Caerostris extrusa]|uniref:C2H2-type domain-containing protein n=1 Tax=Caerostris extrusa TaxID=172846 RepID=A0AAV4TEJ8_CAEEX|nr:hypothetical protein CEXT_615451 [Caerostris extrusa]
MGTATLEISSDNEINENAHKPPEFYPCDECGRMFTKLALRIHKRYCTENIEHCICFVCHLTRLRLRTGDIVAFNSSKNGQNDVYRKYLVDRLKQTLNENKVEDTQKKNSNNAEKRILPWNENISYLHISPKIDVSSENISEEKAVFNNNNTKYFLKSGHGCNSCSRKLFCNFCKEHVYWHLYGLHILRHTKKIEGDQIVCPECSALHSSAAYFLSHYYSHINLHPKD